jgi:hypothetical protein
LLCTHDLIKDASAAANARNLSVSPMVNRSPAVPELAEPE